MMQKEPRVKIYVDGACRGNPGPGGWGVIMHYDDQEKTLSGAEPDTTNNRMELKAAIMGLKALKKPCQIDMVTDSQYVRNGITQWLANWKKNGWRTSDKKAVKNKDLWQALDELAVRHQVIWHWVKGHSGHPENERADELATHAITKMLKGQK